MTAARAPRGRSIEQAEEEDDCPVVRKKPKMAADRPPKAVKQRPAVAAVAKAKKSRARIESSDSSDSEAEVEKAVRYLYFRLNNFVLTLLLEKSFRSSDTDCVIIKNAIFAM
jgi:hypothetical protein